MGATSNLNIQANEIQITSTSIKAINFSLIVMVARLSFTELVVFPEVIKHLFPVPENLLS